MARPNGNPIRCRATGCNSLASKDGWCKNHRPKDRTIRPHIAERDFANGYTWAKHNPSTTYGIIRDHYPIERM